MQKSRKMAAIAFLALLAVTSPSNGAELSEGAGRKDTASKLESAPVDVYIGTYLVRIPSLSFHDNQWTVDAYIWFRWKGELNPPPQDTFALCNGTIDKKDITDAKKVPVVKDGKKEEWEYACIRIQAVITSFWDMSRYPFDSHSLSIVLEDNRESSIVCYIADKDACVVDETCEIPGWKLGLPKAVSRLHDYPTNYGDPEHANERDCEFAGIQIDIPMRRASPMLYAFKVLNGLYFSVLIGLLSFFVRPAKVDVRFGAGVGGVFAAIASQYVIASLIPEAGQFSLVDKVYGLSTAVIFLSLVESAVAYQLWELQRTERAKWLDRISFLVLVSSYVGLNIFLSVR